MGGSEGWGAAQPPTPGEPVFPQRWHGRAFALALLANRLTGGNLDSFRHALERLDRSKYLDEGYFGRWLHAAELILDENGVLTHSAVHARSRKLRGQNVDECAASPMPQVAPATQAQGSVRHVEAEPAFAVGDRVRTRSTPSAGHTRLPQYVRGRVGVVERVQPAFVLPDTNATHEGENPQYVYSVRFDSRELWGADAEAFELTIELFEDYVEAA
jgi:nitrile hydratase